MPTENESLAVVVVGTSPQQVLTFVRPDAPGAPDGCVLTPRSQLTPGWVMVDADPAPVPASVTRWQFRRWLVDHGITPESVEALISASLTDPLDRARALVDWRDAPIVERSHPLLVPMAATLGLTSDAVDAAFREASQYA